MLRAVSYSHWWLWHWANQNQLTFLLKTFILSSSISFFTSQVFLHGVSSRFHFLQHTWEIIHLFCISCSLNTWIVIFHFLLYLNGLVLYNTFFFLLLQSAVRLYILYLVLVVWIFKILNAFTELLGSVHTVQFFSVEFSSVQPQWH